MTASMVTSKYRHELRAGAIRYGGDAEALLRQHQADIEAAMSQRDAEIARLRAQLAAAQADNVALRGALERIHGLNVAWQMDLTEQSADPCTTLDRILAITEPIVSTDAAPGAPLLDAVRGLVEVCDRSAIGEECSCDPRWHRTECIYAKLFTALAAVRAVLSPPQDTAGISRGGDGE